jgi:hypothetical protein
MGIIPDFLLDYISVNTYWTILFTIHALLAVALIGALSHQAISVLMPVRAGAGPAGFVTRFRSVHGASYATAVCVLWIVTFFFGPERKLADRGGRLDRGAVRREPPPDAG